MCAGSAGLCPPAAATAPHPPHLTAQGAPHEEQVLSPGPHLWLRHSRQPAGGRPARQLRQRRVHQVAACGQQPAVAELAQCGGALLWSLWQVQRIKGGCHSVQGRRQGHVPAGAGGAGKGDG